MKYALIYFLCCVTFAAAGQRELWGTVSNGGQFNHGYIFKTDSIGEQFTIIHHFDSVNGSNPGALLAASGNKLYGLTAYGGQQSGTLYNGGVLYEYDLTTSTYTVLQHFGPGNTEINGVFPAGDGVRGLTEYPAGTIWGQLRAPAQGGMIFKYNTATATIVSAVTLPPFMGGTFNTPQPTRMEGALYPAADGFLYGTTFTNSQCPIPSPMLGSIFRIAPGTNTYSIRHLSPCSNTNGIQFESGFLPYNGQLYSITKFGGIGDYGVIYAFDPATSTYTKKHDFQGGTLGLRPSLMVRATNGKFYGTSDGGTAEPGFPSGCGILFEFDPATNTYTKKIDFTYGNGFYMNVGTFPLSLIASGNGKLYGVTTNGVFEYNIALNEAVAKGRFPIDMGWYSPSTPSLTEVCRKPSHHLTADTLITQCAWSTLSLDLESDNATSYVWTHDGEPDPEQAGGTLFFEHLEAADEGTWICTMTNSCGTTETPEVQLLVSDLEAVVTQNGLSLQASSAATYQWIDCEDNSPLLNGASQIYTPVVNGTYAVIISTAGCSDTSACFVFDDLGIDDLQAVSLTVFPNPATSELQLLPQQGIAIERVTLLSTTGQVVLRGTSAIVDVSRLKPGTYFLEVETSAGSWHGTVVRAAN